MNNFILIIMVAGILVMKAVWIRTEIKLFKNRLNFTMLRTNFIELGILLLQLFQIIYFPLPKTTYDNALFLIGIIIYALGMTFAFWGRSSMDRNWGIPGIHKSKQQEKLITRGAFRYSRNPIYVGIIFIFLGFSLAFKSWLVLLRLPLFVYLYRSALREEKLLENKFGNEFREYRSTTPRFLLFI